MNIAIITKLLILCLLLYSKLNYSNTILSASTSYTDVQLAVDLAISGDTVSIPSGISDWGINTLNVSGGIFLSGNGKTNTIIQRTASTTNYLISFDGSNGLSSTLSGLTLQGSYNDDSIYCRGVAFLNGCIDFKVYDCKFTGFANCGVFVGYSLVQRGVIYNNEFIDNYYSTIHNYGYGVVVMGDGTWSTLDLGSDNAVFVEDNFFSGNRHNIASNNGSRYVFRYNEVVGQDPAKNYAMTDAHGLSSSPRGSRSYEIYNNNYSADISTGLQRTAIGIRGGDGVIFNNTCTNKISRTIELWNEGYDCGEYPGQDQIRSLYIWNNEAHDELGYTSGGIANNCDSSIKLNRDYFLVERPGYTPYIYPHPLRDNINVDINELPDDYSFSVYPNPFHNSTTIEIKDYNNQPYKLSVYNQLGEKVKGMNNINTAKFNFNSEGLNSGIYFFKIENKDTRFNGKFIIN